MRVGNKNQVWTIWNQVIGDLVVVEKQVEPVIKKI